MRIPYFGLLALGSAQNQENCIIELEQGTLRIKYCYIICTLNRAIFFFKFLNLKLMINKIKFNK